MRASRAAEFFFALSLLFAAWAMVHVATRWLGMNLYGQPVLTLDKSMIDLGQVSPGQVTIVRVGYRNTGRSPLMISRVRGSCDTCLKIRAIPDDPVGPGQSAFFEIEVAVGSSRGSTQKQALIFSNDWSGRSIPVVLKWVMSKE